MDWALGRKPTFFNHCVMGIPKLCTQGNCLAWDKLYFYIGTKVWSTWVNFRGFSIWPFYSYVIHEHFPSEMWWTHAGKFDLSRCVLCNSVVNTQSPVDEVCCATTSSSATCHQLAALLLISGEEKTLLHVNSPLYHFLDQVKVKIWGDGDVWGKSKGVITRDSVRLCY